MAMFGLFGRDGGPDKAKPAVKAEEASATLPAPARSAGSDRVDADKVARQRRAHREQLFVLVRSAMVSVPLPFKSYKFKVLSLDVSGLLFVVMIDLVGEVDGTASALKTIENLIVSTAATNQDFQVQGVYWRFEVPAKVLTDSVVAQSISTDQTSDARSLAQGMPKGSVLEQIGLDEMLAFRQAQAKAKEQLTKNRASKNPSGASQQAKPAAASAKLLDDDPISSPSPLSATQFGDL